MSREEVLALIRAELSVHIQASRGDASHAVTVTLHLGEEEISTSEVWLDDPQQN